MSIKRQIIIIILISVICAAAAHIINPNRINFGQKSSENQYAEIKEISAKEAFDIYKKKSALFVDARNPAEYQKGHIPKAINLPFDMFGEYYSKVENMFSKKSSIIVYCSNTECHLAEMLIEILSGFGYDQLILFKQGFDIWVKKGYPVQSSEKQKEEQWKNKYCL